MSASDYERATEYLFRRINYERVADVAYGARQFKLARMYELLTRVGNPHLAMPIVHVAGTKGKGSTSAMIAAVLAAAGYRTGLFTSPHLASLEERIAIDGQNCTADQLVTLVHELQPIVEQMDQEAARQGEECGPTYFELTTVMALLHFVRQRVQAAVLEVGMGGRLDSTNVCQPEVSVITSISFDHMRQLGNTLAAIAYEKAGIIKPGVPVVSGVTQDEPRHVIANVAAERKSPLVQVGRDFGYRYTPPKNVDRAPGNGEIDFWYPSSPWPRCAGLRLGLLGRHQGANAAVALAVLAQLRQRGWSISQEHVRQGLLKTRSPARVEVVARRPTVIIDAAHNEASVSALLETLAESFHPQQRRILIFATTQDKEVRAMLGQLLPRFDQVWFTRYRNNPRGVPIEELMALGGELGASHCHAAAEPAEAWRVVAEIVQPEDLVCVTGSFFVAAELRELITARPWQARASSLPA